MKYGNGASARAIVKQLVAQMIGAISGVATTAKSSPLGPRKIHTVSTTWNRDGGNGRGTKANQRAAIKKRNQRRHKLACRG